MISVRNQLTLQLTGFPAHLIGHDFSEKPAQLSALIVTSLLTPAATQAVWDAVFHDTGDFLVSCSLDHSARLWDLAAGKCRQTVS